MLLYTQAIADAQQKRLFEDVYTDYRGRMLTLARRKLRSPEDAEDAVHQAFLSLAEHFDRLAALPGNYKVYPGHEGATELDYERRVNPFMTRRLSL